MPESYGHQYSGVSLTHTDQRSVYSTLRLVFYKLVGWNLTSLFSTNAAISETKGRRRGVILLPSEGRLAIH